MVEIVLVLMMTMISMGYQFGREDCTTYRGKTKLEESVK